jgi:hypothetical protein
VTTPVTQEPPAEPPAPGEEPVPSPEEIAEELEAVAEAEVEQADEPDEADDERRYPSTIGGAFYLLVLASGALGIAIVWSGDWRLGIQCLAGGLCFAALLRLVLPARDAGMLAVRNRWFDAVLLGAMGAALFFLATTIPGAPGQIG